MIEHSLQVSRTARYYVDAVGDEAEQVWFVLHGYGSLAATFAELFHPIVSQDVAVVAPEGLSRYYVRGINRQVGASWMTREFRDAEIRDYVSFLDAVAEDVRPRFVRAKNPINVLGFSQGGPAAARWACLGNTDIRRLILWGSDVPPDLDNELLRTRSQTIRIQLVVGTRDELISPDRVQREVSRLHEHGIRHELVQYDGGHAVDPLVLEQLAAG